MKGNERGGRGEGRKRRKEIKSPRAKPPTPTRAIDALIGDEEQVKKKKTKEIGSETPTQLPWTI